MQAVTTTLDDFSSTLSRAWIWLRRALWIAAAVIALVIVLEAIHLHELLSGIHPWVAWTVTGTLVAALLWLTGRAVLRYLRVPKVLVPPDLPPVDQGWSPLQQQTYLEFAIRYLRRQLVNPRLDDPARERAHEAMATIEKVAAELDPGDRIQNAQALTACVDAELAEVLESLDRTAKRLIRRAAVEVAVATAVSPSIMLDSLITLTRNVNLIASLADLYYGRPGLFGTLRVTRDVLGAAIAAGALEVVSDHLTSVASEITGSWSSRILGPLGQGAVNGIVTMRMGAAARARCRSVASPRVPWRPWRVADYRKSFARLMDWLSEDVGTKFTQPLARWLQWANGGPDEADLDTPPEEPVGLVKERWWKRVFRNVQKAAAPDSSKDESARPDPLLDSDLLDE